MVHISFDVVFTPIIHAPLNVWQLVTEEKSLYFSTEQIATFKHCRRSQASNTSSTFYTYLWWYVGLYWRCHWLGRCVPSWSTAGRGRVRFHSHQHRRRMHSVPLWSLVKPDTGWEDERRERMLIRFQLDPKKLHASLWFYFINVNRWEEKGERLLEGKWPESLLSLRQRLSWT